MPHIYIGENTIWRQGEEDTQTFPSGLIRCVAKFVCRKSYEETALETLVPGYEHPTRLGLYLQVAPAAQIGRNGYVEFNCTFYGKHPDVDSFEEYSRNIITHLDLQWQASTCRISCVVPTIDVEDAIVIPTPSRDSNIIRTTGGGGTVVMSEWDPAGYTSTNYGIVSEVVASYQSKPV